VPIRPRHGQPVFVFEAPPVPAKVRAAFLRTPCADADESARNSSVDDVAKKKSSILTTARHGDAEAMVVLMPHLAC
jgi:hypothetical protein